VDATTFLVLLDDRGSLVVAAAAGAIGDQARGMRVPADGAAWRGPMIERTAERTDRIEPRLRQHLDTLGIEATSALLVPMAFRNRSLGVLAAFSRASDDAGFSAEDESLLTGFATSSAMAVATAQTVAEARLRDSIEIAERERRRWARELHDETLQGLGALRVRLATSLRGDPQHMAEAVMAAVVQIEDEIANLRSLITELRPAALDELGLEAAIESLVDSHTAATGHEVRMTITLALESGVIADRLNRELESAIYRIVQEALTNVARHASAERVWVEVSESSESILIVVRDDGAGFDMDRRTRGFGLIGMRERVALRGGSPTIVSTPGTGTELRGRIPLRPEVAAGHSGGLDP